jgi:hypothetical protein
VLYGFPGNQESDEVKTPLAQPGEMLICFMYREWPADKGNVSMLEEMLSQMGGSIWIPGDFTAATEVDTAQKQSPAFIIYQPIVFNAQVDFTQTVEKCRLETRSEVWLYAFFEDIKR